MNKSNYRMENDMDHLPHDPMPSVRYVMQTGTAGGWGGPLRFAPRDGYCQDHDCYIRADAERASA